MIDHMKLNPLPVATVLCSLVAVILLGCGGGGGGSATSSTTATTGTTASGRTQIELVALTGTGATVDPLNLRVGASVKFTLVNVNLSTGALQSVSNSPVTTTDTGNVAGTFVSNTGQFTALNPTNGVQYTASSTYGGATYSTNYAVTSNTTSVSGQVTDSNGVPVAFAQVNYYDGSGNLVGGSVSNTAGTFTGFVPATAVRFNVLNTTISPSYYYRILEYGIGTYALTGSTCAAPLPTLTAGSSVSLPNTLVFPSLVDAVGASTNPPPPPTCSP